MSAHKSLFITLRLLALTMLSSALWFIGGCSTTEKLDVSTPEGAFQQAERYEKDERYEEAILKYTDLKNKHPYSRYAQLAELRAADVQFKRESYIEAQYAYQSFKDLHPKHPQIDYVTLRLGLSYFNQLPSTIDRDLSLADKAILYFDEVLTAYPNSQYAKEALQKKIEARKMLADKESYIADFYYKKKQYQSALGRYETVLRLYADVDGVAPGALLGAYHSAQQTGDRDKSNRYYQTLVKKFPQSNQAQQAKSEN